MKKRLSFSIEHAGVHVPRMKVDATVVLGRCGCRISPGSLLLRVVDHYLAYPRS
jgi:hypothetical protein